MAYHLPAWPQSLDLKTGAGQRWMYEMWEYINQLSVGSVGDPTLVALAAFNSNGLLTQTAADTFTARTITGTAGTITVTNGNGVSGNPTLTIAATYVGQSSITTLGTIATGVWQGSSISTTYTDAKLKTLTGTANRITIGGTATDPTADISTSYVGQNTITTLGTITTGVWNGTKVSEIYGGTNQATYALGDTLYSSAANTLAKLSGNTTTTKKFLRQTGDGANSAAPAWDTIVAADVPGSALTKTDDTNVTLTLGGSPTTALLNATSLTLGWTGQLSVARGGTGQSTYTDGQLLIGNTTGNTLTKATLTGTSNQITVTNGSGSITLSTPQNIHTGATPTFAGITLTGLADLSGASAGQIKFPSTQNASANANTLDDYEEGTWTPVIEGNTTAGTATYTRQAGTYTKIGNRVFFAVDIVWNSGTGTGTLKITGLPFSSSSTSYLKLFNTFTDGVTMTAGNLPMMTLGISATYMLMNQVPTGGGTATEVPYDAAGQIVVQGHYEID